MFRISDVCSQLHFVCDDGELWIIHIRSGGVVFISSSCAPPDFMSVVLILLLS
jgi:hypothetical protein